MVKYEIGTKPTPQAMDSRRMPMYGTFLVYSLFVFFNHMVEQRLKRRVSPDLNRIQHGLVYFFTFRA